MMDAVGNWLLEWAGWIFGFVATVFAVKGNINFDVNQWLNDKRKIKKENLRTLCPHVYPTKQDGKLCVRSAFISPSGTGAWQCQQCGCTTYDEFKIEQEVKHWAKNPDELIKVMKEAKKLSDKINH